MRGQADGACRKDGLRSSAKSKWGTPRSGALGGSRGYGSHSKFSPQNNHLRLFCYCENFVCYFSTDFVRVLKVGKNKKWGNPLLLRRSAESLFATNKFSNLKYI